MVRSTVVKSPLLKVSLAYLAIELGLGSPFANGDRISLWRSESGPEYSVITLSILNTLMSTHESWVCRTRLSHLESLTQIALDI